MWHASFYKNIFSKKFIAIRWKRPQRWTQNRRRFKIVFIYSVGAIWWCSHFTTEPQATHSISCMLKLIFILLLTHYCAAVLLLLPQATHRPIVHECVCCVYYVNVCYIITPIIIIDSLMLILRNMCCYLSVSRLSVLVCVMYEWMCASSGYEIYQFLFVSPSLFSLPHSYFDLFLSLSMIRCWLAWRFIFHCIHSFSRSSFLDRHFCSFVCALLICTWLHNNAQFYSAEIEYFGLNVPDDWRAADGPFIELSIRMKKERTKNSR